MKHLERSSRRQLLRMGAALGGGILAARQEALGLGHAGKAGHSARPLRRTVAVREGGPLAARLEDAGDRLQLHAPPGLGRHADAVGAALRAASRGHPDDRSGAASAGDSRHGGSAALAVDGRDPAPAVGDAHAGARMRRQQRRRVGGADGRRRPAQLRPRQRQRVDRRAAVAAARAKRACSPRASWVIAEGADACRMERSIPLAKAMENIAARVRPERRSDSSRAGISAAADQSRAGKATRT